MMPKIGDALKPFRFGPVDPQAMVIWAGILKDPNPIHLDVEAVKAMGLGDKRINQGPANLAYLINTVFQSFPNAKIEKISNRFGDNVFESDTIEAKGTVTEVEHLPGACRITCELTLEVNGNRNAVTGTVVAQVTE